MRVKICGITSYEDAIVAINAGADALGFVFYEKSPRFIDKDRAKNIIKKLPPFVEIVGLFVNESADVINETCLHIGASLAQIHFEAKDELFASLKIRYIKVILAKNKNDISRYSHEYRLIDAYSSEYGGSGKTLNLNWFNDVDCSKIILAGGLTPKNLKQLSKYNFFGVDVSSGVEKAKGIKDPQKIKKFIINASKYSSKS